MAQATSITLDKLFEYVIAAMLRGSGYVAGVPTRRIGGRGTTHQIDVIGIEFTHLPFLYDTILLVEAKCYDPNETVGIEVVRQVKSNIIDLEQTLPRTLNVLPRNVYPIDYFTRILGNSSGEGMTACYRGAIFTTAQFSRYAKEFAYAHGIYLFNFPPTIGANPVIYWVGILKGILIALADNPKDLRLYLPLVRRDDTLDYYHEIVVKLRKDYSSLEPEERHYLFTLIRGILERHPDLQPFWKELEKLCVVEFNGYPILALLSERISIDQTRRVLKEYLQSTQRKSARSYVGSRTKISNMKLVKDWSERRNEDLFEVSFSITTPENKMLEGRLFVPSTLHTLFDKGDVTLILPFMEGLNLVARYKGNFRKLKYHSPH